MQLLPASRQPFLGLALTAAMGIGIGDFVPLPANALTVAIVSAAVAAAVLLWKPRVVVTYLFVFCSFFLLHELRTSTTAGLILSSQLSERPRVITATGAVVSEPKLAENGIASFLFRLNTIQLDGKTRPSNATILVRWRGNPAFGDELQLFGMASPVAAPRNPGEFDMRAYLARRDVRRVLFVRYPEDGILLRSNVGNTVLRLAQLSRRWLQSVLCRGLDDSPDVRNFISGITLGLRHQTPEDIEEPFQQTGTLHLFAVAGLHVGIVARLLWVVAGVLHLSRRWAALIIIPLVLFYSAITGLHVSSVRAAVMTAVLMGGLLVDRRVFSLNSLAAAAALLLVWDTNELFATGFQLSFAVVTAIVVLSEPVAGLFQRLTAPDPFLPRSLLPRLRRIMEPVLHKVTQSAAVSIAAWIGSLGLILWYFYLITPISLLANLIVVPIAFLILAVALLSIVSAPLSSVLSIVFNNANWFLAKTVIGIVHLFAQLPAGHYYLPHPPGLGSALAKITVLDLGAGATIHLHSRSCDWLFDCGSERNYEKVVRDYLHAAGVNRLSGLLLTHGDSQHIGGAARLLSEIRPGLLVDNPAPDRSSVHKRLRSFLEQRGLKLVRPVQGETLPLGWEIGCSVLYPPRGFTAPMADDQALVLQLRCGSGPRLLLMSDSGVSTETTLLRSGADLRSDIVIKGQHHSGQSGSAEFMNAVQPRLVVATSRDFPQHERLNEQWTAELRRRHITVFPQSETGAVEILVWSNNWEARPYLTGEILRSSSR
jgi:competence protein ComEC